MKFLSWIWKPRPTHTVTVIVHGDGWGWHEKGANGEITCHSERYPTAANAERAARDHCLAKRVFKP